MNAVKIKLEISCVLEKGTKIVSGKNLDNENLKSEAKKYVGYGIGFN